MKDVQAQLTKTFGQVEPLTYVCAAVIVLYIAIAKPSNTPSFFNHPIFKAILFIVVFVVTLMDPVIGTLFGLAMVLSVAYASEETERESFVSDTADAAAVLQQDSTQEEEEGGFAEEEGGLAEEGEGLAEEQMSEEIEMEEEEQVPQQQQQVQVQQQQQQAQAQPQQTAVSGYPSSSNNFAAY